MMTKRERAITLFIIIIVTAGLSSVLGDYAAQQMVHQAVVKNAMLCQILFLAGMIAGSTVVLVFQAWEHARIAGSGEDN